MPDRRIGDEDYAALISQMESGQVGSHNWEVGRTKLTLANMEAQAVASERLVKSTDELVKATRALGGYTMALVVATAILVVVTALSIFRLKQ